MCFYKSTDILSSKWVVHLFFPLCFSLQQTRCVNNLTNPLLILFLNFLQSEVTHNTNQKDLNMKVLELN